MGARAVLVLKITPLLILRNARTVAHKAAGRDGFAPRIHRWDRVARCQSSELLLVERERLGQCREFETATVLLTNAPSATATAQAVDPAG